MTGVNKERFEELLTLIDELKVKLRLKYGDRVKKYWE